MFQKQIIFFISILSFTFSFAQESKVHISANYGYYFGTNKQVLGSELSGDLFGDAGLRENVLSGSFGGGMAPGISVDYWITPFVAIGISGDYLLGNNVMVASGSAQGIGQLDAESRSSMLRIAPVISMSTDRNAKFYGFGRAGVDLIPLARIKTESTASLADDLTDLIDIPFPLPGLDLSLETTEELKGRFGVGYHFEIGAGVNVSKLLAVQLGIDYRGYTLQAQTSKITALDVAGFDTSAFLNPYDLETSYTDELTSSSNNSEFNPDFDPNQPREALSERFSASGIGAKISVVIKL